VATNYDVVVSYEAANEARRLLHQLPMTQEDAATPAGYARHLPYQPGPEHGAQQPGQQGHAPQRPASWNDPYGQKASETAGPPSGHEPAAGHPAEPAPHPTEAPAHTAADAEDAEEEAKPAGFAYPDLPDGRPQYGVRVTDTPKQEPGQDGSRH
jgi:hypothetical protein